MSLFSSIQLANNSLRAMQVGLQVVGQNIANANTPGYIREEVALTPAPTQRVGNLLLGLGVNVTAIVQKIDHFVEDRLRGSTSDRVSAETQEQTFLQLEGLVAELGDTDLSTSLTNFFNSISEVLNQPESVSIRNLAVLQAQTLTADFNRIAQRVVKIGSDLNDRVVTIGDDINRLTTEIQTLNIRIASMEGGGSNPSDAVGLRDQRGVALGKLAELVDIRVHEQPSGAVNVYVGGDYLVLEGVRRAVAVQKSSGDGVPKAEIQFAETQSPLQFQGGELAGLITGRDTILGGFLDELNDYASTLAFEFNKIFSSGQGLTGYHSINTEFAVDDTTAALNAAGLPFTPVNGSFDLMVLNKQTGLTSTTSIRIDLNGYDSETSLDDLAAQINAVEGMSASISLDRKLQIRTTGANTEFAFANDTSGVLAALGINTLFSGTSALNMSVSETMAADPSKFAASGGGIGEDTKVAVQLAALLEKPLDTQGGNTLLTLYDRLIGNVTQGSTVAQSVAEGSRVFEATLQGQQLAISGVNLDEEAVKMITYQRAYQASARYIATISELLDILVNL